MKPIRLTLGGLHSYRDPVVIDFESLGRFGLFGIFGPIGAGKSTVLDAMTLALYGLVDRVVGRSRRGLVYAGDPTVRCEVRFRFEVGTGRPGDSRRLYEVNRAYRDEAGVAQRVASRLVELPSAGPPLTLAEKETEVNAAIEELVGLSSEDFLRAVVLPQGRFVQLLQLKGLERRQMLQRIFRLQAYGEDLRARVRDRQSAGRARQGEVRGELAGLGDASPPTVAAAVRVAREARALRDEAEQRQLALVAEHEAAARLRERHQRWLTLTVTLDANEVDRPRMEALAQELARAERLRPLLPALRRCDEASARSAAAQQVATTTRERRARSTADLALRSVAAETLRQRLSTEAPDARLRINRLEEAVRSEQRLAALAEESTTWADALELHVTEESSARAEADRLRVRVGELDRERRKLRRELTKTRVSPEEREGVTRAARAADAVHVARRLAEEARAEELAAAGAVLIARQRAVEAEAGVVEASQVLGALADRALPPVVDPAPLVDRASQLVAQVAQRGERDVQLAAARLDLDQAQQALAAARAAEAGAAGDIQTASSVLRGAERALEEAERLLLNHQQRSAAWQLATRLGPGVACAVCGSTHHPAPTSAPTDDPAPAVDAHKLGRQRALDRRERALEARAAAESSRVGAEGRVASATERILTLEAGLESLPTPAALTEALEARDAALAHHAARQQHAAEVAAAQTLLERARVPVAAAEATVVAAQAEALRTRELRELRSRAQDLAWGAFDAERGALTLFDVGSAVAALEARDRQVHVWTQEVEGLDHDREATARAAEDERTRAERAAAAAVRAREHREAAETQMQGLREALSLVLGAFSTATAAEHLAAEEATLAALEREVASAEEGLRVVAATSSADAEDHAAAEAAARSATAEALRVRDELLVGAVAVVGENPMDPIGALRALVESLPGEDTLAQRAADLERWRQEGHSLRVRLQELEELGTEGALDDATWSRLEATLLAAEARLDDVRDEAIAAARAADELSSRAARWSTLTSLSESLDAEVARLDELAQLLRGDRFVEYVANDHLQELTSRASVHLAGLSGGRYTLSLDDESSFVVCDQELGGVARPVSGLSGGESFLTALSLALSLSSLVQARSTRPLGFFFLDEGFGTLDPDALDRVMTAIEGMRSEDRLIGLISHVPEVRDRVPRYLAVSRAPGGSSSIVVVDG